MPFEKIKTELPKFCIIVSLPEPMTGQQIARMLERRLGKNVYFRRYKTEIVGAINGADTLILSGPNRIGPAGVYKEFWIEATANRYKGKIAPDEITALITQITDCSK